MKAHCCFCRRFVAVTHLSGYCEIPWGRLAFPIWWDSNIVVFRCKKHGLVNAGVYY